MKTDKKLIGAGLLTAIASSLCCITPILAIVAGSSGIASTLEDISIHNINTHTIDVSAWPSGMYIISGDHLVPKTFVKI